MDVGCGRRWNLEGSIKGDVYMDGGYGRRCGFCKVFKVMWTRIWFVMGDVEFGRWH